MLVHVEINPPDWQPAANMCYQNATDFYCRDPRYQPVRGWLYFDLADAEDYVFFIGHSAIEIPEGELWDITPLNAIQQYPFISSGLAEENFAELVDILGPDGKLIHYK